MPRIRPLAVTIAAVLLAAVGYAGWVWMASDPAPETPSPDRITVPLAMLVDPDGPPDRGCDDVVFVEHRVPVQEDPLTAALDTLFSIKADSVNGARHFLSQTNETLRFDHAEVDGDTVRVFLSGRLTGLRGVCDDPRARIQIEETARRITGKSGVVLYLDGSRTSLQPDGRGRRGNGGRPHD